MLWMSISLMYWILLFLFYLPHFLISFPVKLDLHCLMLQMIVAFIPLICYVHSYKTFLLFFVTCNCVNITHHSHLAHICNDITYFFPILPSHRLLSLCCLRFFLFIADSSPLSWGFSTVMANFWQWFRTSVWRSGNYYKLHATVWSTLFVQMTEITLISNTSHYPSKNATILDMY